MVTIANDYYRRRDKSSSEIFDKKGMVEGFISLKNIFHYDDSLSFFWV